jgi:hypothetical protein
MNDIEIEGTSGEEQKKQKCLIVQTYTRNSINYKAIIGNPDNVQYPEIFLTQKMAIESIIKHISSEPSYVYDEKTDTIEIKYNIIGTYGICIQLKKDLTQAPTIEQRITKIELLLETLVLDELIESHQYPTWDTYEEFMKLPSYKYFDAFHNAQRYFNKEPLMHLGKFREFYYGLVTQDLCGRYLSFSCSNNTDQEKQQFLTYLSDFIKPTRIIQNKEWELTTKDIQFYSTLYKQQSIPNTQIGTDCFRDYFQSSLKTFIKRDANYNRWLCDIINEYIRMYITGFYLINHQLLIARSIRIELHINNDKMYIHIFRSKALTFKHYNVKQATSLTICNIDKIKIDGVYVM